MNLSGLECVNLVCKLATDRSPWGSVASSRYTCAEVGVNGEGDYGIREQ